MTIFSVVTDDDRYETVKQELCAQVGCQYLQLPKTPPRFSAISTSEIVRSVAFFENVFSPDADDHRYVKNSMIRAPDQVPLRVDFAGGWLDVPKFSRSGAFVVNCAISPLVSIRHWPYKLRSGLGGSGAWAILNGKPGVSEELKLGWCLRRVLVRSGLFTPIAGVGWQDPAVIAEGGLCVWKSGHHPELEVKSSGVLECHCSNWVSCSINLLGNFLSGRMALFWTGSSHDTPGSASLKRDYDVIAAAGHIARNAVWGSDLLMLAEAIRLSYSAQIGVCLSCQNRCQYFLCDFDR